MAMIASMDYVERGHLVSLNGNVTRVTFHKVLKCYSRLPNRGCAYPDSGGAFGYGYREITTHAHGEDWQVESRMPLSRFGRGGF